jgi:hypothetical protein
MAFLLGLGALSALDSLEKRGQRLKREGAPLPEGATVKRGGEKEPWLYHSISEVKQAIADSTAGAPLVLFCSLSDVDRGFCVAEIVGCDGDKAIIQVFQDLGTYLAVDTIFVSPAPSSSVILRKVGVIQAAAYRGTLKGHLRANRSVSGLIQGFPMFEQVARWPCTAVNRTVAGDGTPWAALYAPSLSQQQPSTQQAAQVAAGGQMVTQPGQQPMQMSQQPTMQTSPATPAVMPTFDSALAAAGLAQHATALRDELGCQEREDLLELDADDVASLGLSSSDLDRLRQAAQPQPRAPSTQRATAAASVAVTASAGRSPSGPAVPTLDSALAAAGLVQHATALRELGCQEAEDLVDLEEGDVASIGLSSSDLDRLRDAAAGKAVTCTATAANPRPTNHEGASSADIHTRLPATAESPQQMAHRSDGADIDGGDGGAFAGHGDVTVTFEGPKLGLILTARHLDGSEPASNETCAYLEITAVSPAFPSWKRSILTEIYLCHACSHHEVEDGNARAGA